MFSPEAVIHTEASPSITQSVCLYGQRGVCTFVVGVMVKVVEVVVGGDFLACVLLYTYESPWQQSLQLIVLGRSTEVKLSTRNKRGCSPLRAVHLHPAWAQNSQINDDSSILPDMWPLMTLAPGNVIQNRLIINRTAEMEKHWFWHQLILHRLHRHCIQNCVFFFSDTSVLKKKKVKKRKTYTRRCILYFYIEWNPIYINSC